MPDTTALGAVDLLGRAVEADLVSDIEAGDLPRVLALEPRVGCFELGAVGREKLLCDANKDESASGLDSGRERTGWESHLENAVLVAETVAPFVSGGGVSASRSERGGRPKLTYRRALQRSKRVSAARKSLAAARRVTHGRVSQTSRRSMQRAGPGLHCLVPHRAPRRAGLQT